jgi:hypothetical protein
MQLRALIFFIIVALLPIAADAVNVQLADPNRQAIPAGSILRVDLVCDNRWYDQKEMSISAKYDPFFALLTTTRKITLEADETRLVSYYFKINPKIYAGDYSIDFEISIGTEKINLSKPLVCAPTTKISLSRTIFEDEYAQLEVTNSSNHPITISKDTIAPYSTKKIPYTFKNKKSNNYYHDTVPVYYNHQVITNLSLFCKTNPIYRTIQSNEEFHVPFNYGFAYSTNKSKQSLNIYAKGGGQITKNQDLKFNFSAPFYGSGQYPYLYWDPEAALFFIDYRYKKVGIKAGDSYFENNSYLYYRYGRGYVGTYDNLDNFRLKAGYVTKNKFYDSSEKDYIFSLEKTTNPKVSYHSFLGSGHYNQNFGIKFDDGTSSKGYQGSVQLFNTDFAFDHRHSGVLGTLSFQNDAVTSSFSTSYIGNQFLGRTNSQATANGLITGRLPNYQLSSTIRANYNRIFPMTDPPVSTLAISAALSKRIGKSSNSLTFNYQDYSDVDLNRKNYSLYYSFAKPFGLDYYLSADQGATYSEMGDSIGDRLWKTYTRINASYQRARWSFDTGIYSQVRFYSDSSSQQNSFYIGTSYRFKQQKARVNFSFSNGTFNYRPSVSVNYNTKIKNLDIEIDYHLTPTFDGYNWRALAKFNVLNFLHFKKPVELQTKFIDKTTSQPIESMVLDETSLNRLTVKEGRIVGNYSEDELRAMTFGELSVSRQLSKNVEKDVVRKEVVFQIDYRVKVVGHLKIQPKFTARSSLNRLILEQKIYALSEEGKYYFGSLEHDGSFFIPNLPVGRYQIGIALDKLPLSVTIEEQTVMIDYQKQVYEANLTARY